MSCDSEGLTSPQGSQGFPKRSSQLRPLWEKNYQTKAMARAKARS